MRAIVIHHDSRPQPVFTIPDDASDADVAAAVLFLAQVGGLDVEVNLVIEARSVADFHAHVAAYGRQAAEEIAENLT